MVWLHPYPDQIDIGLTDMISNEVEELSRENRPAWEQTPSPTKKESALYSVIIPVYNSETLVGTTVAQTLAFFHERGLRCELLLINDHSRDGSWKVIRELAEREEEVVAVNLLRNYGQHSAVLCGIGLAQGDFFITMDDDMQNPPEEIIWLIDKIHEGYDAVFAKFRKKKHSFVRRLGSLLVGYLNYKVFGKPKKLTLSNFRIFRRDVADRMKTYSTYFPYIPGLILLHASDMANVETEHRPRPTGKSNYSIVKILELVARLLFSYSSYPLRLLISSGFILSFLSFGFGIYILLKYLFVGVAVPGWTTVVLLQALLSGFIIVILGIMGEYLIRVLNQVSSVQPFHIKEIIGTRE